MDYKKAAITLKAHAEFFKRESMMRDEIGRKALAHDKDLQEAIAKGDIFGKLKFGILKDVAVAFYDDKIKLKNTESLQDRWRREKKEREAERREDSMRENRAAFRALVGAAVVLIPFLIWSGFKFVEIHKQNKIDKVENRKAEIRYWNYHYGMTYDPVVGDSVSKSWYKLRVQMRADTQRKINDSINGVTHRPDGTPKPQQEIKRKKKESGYGMTTSGTPGVKIAPGFVLGLDGEVGFGY